MYPYWPRNILDDLLPHVLESIGKPVADMFADGARDADPPRLGKRLQPGSDIYAVAEDVLGFDDHIAKVDPDAESNAPLFGHFRLTVNHPSLNLHRASPCIDHTRKFRQHSVAGVLHDPGTMLGDLRINELAQMRLEALVRTLLVSSHQAGVTGHIRSKDRGETAG